MKIRVFDIRWRMRLPGVPDVVEYPITSSGWAMKHTQLFKEGVVNYLHNTYLTKPLFFRYVLGKSPKVYTYEHTDI